MQSVTVSNNMSGLLILNIVSVIGFLLVKNFEAEIKISKYNKKDD